MSKILVMVVHQRNCTCFLLHKVSRIYQESHKVSARLYEHQIKFEVLCTDTFVFAPVAHSNE